MLRSIGKIRKFTAKRRWCEGSWRFERAKMKQKKAENARLLASIKQKLSALAYTTGGKDFTKLFAYFDRDRDGDLDINEFTRGVRRAGITSARLTDADINVLLKAIDVDDSGTITLKEFVDFLANDDENRRNEKEKRRNERREKAHEEKAALIAEHKKLQLLHKLHSKLQAKAYTHTGKDFGALFRQFDVNNDDSLTYEEFRRAIRRSGICDKRLEDDELQHVMIAVDVHDVP